MQRNAHQSRFEPDRHLAENQLEVTDVAVVEVP